MIEEATLFHWVWDVCIAGSVLGCGYALVATLLAVRFGRLNGRRAAAHREEAVTLLKPLCGMEPDLSHRLSSFCRQDYAAPVQIVFGVQDRADRAIAEVEEVRRLHPAADIVLETNGRTHGSNRKVSNLVNMAARIRHDVLILSDSDIEVGPAYIGEVVGALQQPGVGAVTCLYHGVPGAPGLWPRLAALSINAQFLPNAVVALSLGLAKPCFGATIAVRAQTLNRLGGFIALADTLADDYALGEAVRVGGLETVVAPGTVGHACFPDGVRDLFLHHVRSARTIRSIDPIGYVGSIITNPLPLALVGLAGGAAGGVAAVAAAIACRMLLCFAAERAFRLPRQSYWLVPVRDLFEFTVYVASFFVGNVSWKGHRYRVDADGTLIQDPRTGRT
jgi:ceramide glucosyltransferase